MRTGKDSVKNKSTLTYRVMRKLIPGFIALLLICLIAFEILPDNNITIMHCDWDWLSFVGTLAGIFLACWGVVKTIESTHEATLEQAMYSAKPLLNTSMYSDFDKSKLKYADGVLYSLSISNGVITKDSKFYYLSFVKPNEYSNVFTALRIENIGLGAAVNITPFLRRVNVDNNMRKEIEVKGVKNIYDTVQFDSDREELTSFSLGNGSTAFFIVFNQKNRDDKSAHYVLEFEYDDMYGNTYTQMQYLLLISNGCRPLHISTQKEVNKE